MDDALRFAEYTLRARISASTRRVTRIVAIATNCYAVALLGSAIRQAGKNTMLATFANIPMALNGLECSRTGLACVPFAIEDIALGAVATPLTLKQTVAVNASSEGWISNPLSADLRLLRLTMKMVVLQEMQKMLWFTHL